MRPEELIPHRAPFLFVDEIIEVVAGKSATGRWVLSGEEPFFAGHFPGSPTLPGVLMVEAIAQMGAIALLADDRYRGKLPLFGGIDRARFRRRVGPGDTLVLSATLGSLTARAGKGTGTVTVDGRVACEADLLFVIVDGIGSGDPRA